MFNHQAQQGFLTLAIGADYLRMAYAQALSVKTAMPDALYAVAVDAETKLLITDKHMTVFDYVVDVPEFNNPMQAEPELFWVTPFKETIKLEADLLIPRNINHWWTALRHRELVISTNCRDYRGNIVVDTTYRRLWADNNLPNVYNGLMYFRFTRENLEFFMLARDIFANWDAIKEELKNCRDDAPETDQVYALAASIHGVERSTMPSLDFFTMTHMKPHIQGWPYDTVWPTAVITEVYDSVIRINNVEQLYPFHYHEKDWLTEDIINTYESIRSLRRIS
jgi:hypothetical protein